MSKALALAKRAEAIIERHKKPCWHAKAGRALTRFVFEGDEEARVHSLMSEMSANGPTCECGRIDYSYKVEDLDPDRQVELLEILRAARNRAALLGRGAR